MNTTKTAQKQTLHVTVKTQRDELETLLKNHKGNGFAHIVTKTVPDMNKTNNPFFGNVWKITDTQIQAGFHYINSVNNQLTREGKSANAIAKARTWGHRIDNTPLVEHTNKQGEHRLYLEAKCERVNSVHYVDGTGQQIDKTLLTPWLKSKGAKSSTQANVDKEIVLRDYALDSILWIAIDGKEIGEKPTIAPCVYSAV